MYVTLARGLAVGPLDDIVRCSNILRRKGRSIPKWIQCAKNLSMTNRGQNKWLTFILNDARSFVKVHILCFSLCSHLIEI
jgi:hypothetical protein